MMDKSNTIAWNDWADACAFLGNSLLKPITQTETVGLDARFWNEFPNFENDEVIEALRACEAFAKNIPSAANLDAALTEVAVEYTCLFVGPPQPAAAPWQTFYGANETTVGFGEATFQMRKLLAEEGLSLSGSSNQYEDHIGIELLFASELARKIESNEAYLLKLQQFVSEYPLSWIDRLISRVSETYSEGYIKHILVLSKALLMCLL